MSLTLDEVAHIAHLARLNLAPEELELYREQLSAILEHVARLAELDTTGIEPMTRVREGRRSLRADEPRPGLGQEKLAGNAPDWHEDQFRVPPVFD
jgi:aspartyl-tRNA(Asn)/glutamyl-tRNA(Gln) amidotransferase subunit C